MQLETLGVRRLNKRDGSVVVVHLWRAAAGKTTQNVLVVAAHGTGFNGMMWRQTAEHFARTQRGNTAVYFASVDFQNHGQSSVVSDPEELWDEALDEAVRWRKLEQLWENHGDDLLTVRRHLVDIEGGPAGQGNWSRVVGLGHSMGSASLLMATCQRPGMFDELLLFEPIVWCMDVTLPKWSTHAASHPMIATTLRRRGEFPNDREALFRTLSNKDFWRSWDADVLRDWIDGAFRPSADGSQLQLVCTPRLEALYYSSFNDVWSSGMLANLSVYNMPRVWLVHSKRFHLASTYPRLQQRLPRCTRVVCDGERDHFWPFTHPQQVASLLHTMLDTPSVCAPGAVVRLDADGVIGTMANSRL